MSLTEYKNKILFEKYNNLYFSSFNEQEKYKKVIIMDKTFNLPKKVLVSEKGILNPNNIKLDNKFINDIMDQIELYNRLNYIYNIINNYN
jgi:hypothetical protein